MSDPTAPQTSQEPPAPEGLPGIDLDFLHRVYRTSLALVVIGGLLIWARFQEPAALGWLLGAGIGLTVLVSVEWGVRRFIRPGAQSAGALVLLSMAKILGIAVILGLAFVGAMRGWISLPWVLAGFTLPVAVVALKLLGQKLLQATGAERRT
jgi:hypothetical protein